MNATLLLLVGAIAQLATGFPSSNAHHHGVHLHNHFHKHGHGAEIEQREVAECIVPSTTTESTVKQTVGPFPRPHVIGHKPFSGINPFSANGLKAGLSGYPGINLYDTDAMDTLAPYIGWYSDYEPNTPDYGHIQGIPMLWGDGIHCSSTTDVVQRVDTFWNTIATSTPKIMFGFYEPDCECPMSSDMSDPVYGAQKWNQMLAPLTKKGTVLGSPPMCKQCDEDWLTPFKEAGLDADWDVTSIHINTYNLDGVKKDVEHYASKYGKPIWVSELACVHAGPDYFNPCTDQAEIDNFINTVVPWLEANETIVAYGASNGEGLGDVWPLTKGGTLSHTGYTYLNALKNLKN